MSNEMKKDFASLVENQLTDLGNQFADCDVSAGSANNLIASIDAAASWGLLKEIDKKAKKIFLDECDGDDLDHRGAEMGYSRHDGETDSAYRARLLGIKREKNLGGNKSDFEKWAREVSVDHDTYVEHVKDFYIHQHARGIGSVNFIITSDRSAENGGEEEPSAELLAAIAAKFEDQAPVDFWNYQVLALGKNIQDVSLEVTGNCDTVATKSSIESFMKNLGYSRNFYAGVQLENIAFDNGATDATITAPTSELITVKTGPDEYTRIWPGTVTVTAG